MKKIIIIIIVLGGIYSYKPGLFNFFKQTGSYVEQGDGETLVFTHKKCGKPCRQTISLLKNRRVPFREYKLDGNDENQALWKQYGGVNSFPNVIIGDEKVYGSYKGLIVSRLALFYGEEILTQSERYYMDEHFYNDGKPKLVMYGASWCPYCKKLRKGLNKNSIRYVEIDVDKSPRKVEMSETMNIGGFPVVYYGYKRLVGSRLKDVKAVL